jgi:hypothetical protein
MTDREPTWPAGKRDSDLTRRAVQPAVERAFEAGAPGYAVRVLLALVDLVALRSKPQDHVTRRAISELTGMSERNVTRGLGWLAQHDVLEWLPGGSIPGGARYSSRATFRFSHLPTGDTGDHRSDTSPVTATGRDQGHRRARPGTPARATRDSSRPASEASPRFTEERSPRTGHSAGRPDGLAPARVLAEKKPPRRRGQPIDAEVDPAAMADLIGGHIWSIADKPVRSPRSEYVALVAAVLPANPTQPLARWAEHFDGTGRAPSAKALAAAIALGALGPTAAAAARTLREGQPA